MHIHTSSLGRLKRSWSSTVTKLSFYLGRDVYKLVISSRELGGYTWHRMFLLRQCVLNNTTQANSLPAKLVNPHGKCRSITLLFTVLWSSQWKTPICFWSYSLDPSSPVSKTLNLPLRRTKDMPPTSLTLLLPSPPVSVLWGVLARHARSPTGRKMGQCVNWLGHMVTLWMSYSRK